MLIVTKKLHFMVLFGSRISVLIKQIHEKLLFLSHKLLFFASFSSLLFVLSFFLLFSHHGSISKQNTFKMDTKNNNHYFLILNLKSDCPGEKDQCWWGLTLFWTISAEVIFRVKWLLRSFLQIVKTPVTTNNNPSQDSTGLGK